LAIVPEIRSGGPVEVRIASGLERSEPVTVMVAKRLAGDLHRIQSTLSNPDERCAICDALGSRGEHSRKRSFAIDVSGEVLNSSGDITNPTGIAFSPDGQMF
jgi:hypothetical protein